MKRIIAAALLASLTVPAFAQTQSVNPVVQQRTQVAGPASAGASAASVPAGSAAAAAGAFASSEATGPWANDWNFIAPPP